MPSESLSITFFPREKRSFHNSGAKFDLQFKGEVYQFFDFPRVEKLWHWMLKAAAGSLHQPFSTTTELSERKGTRLQVLSSFSGEALASTCAYSAGFCEEICFLKADTKAEQPFCNCHEIVKTSLKQFQIKSIFKVAIFVCAIDYK